MTDTIGENWEEMNERSGNGKPEEKQEVEYGVELERSTRWSTKERRGARMELGGVKHIIIALIPRLSNFEGQT